ncbi:hypothetical protein E3N88_32926 [Mikania micrantha]|uniref:Uncharacterized protein n=1 Tax=Mikania micrantha TaxID=192012 RepID=A0A5N6MAG0_9ASTR|nr:hypothetical protein E3N88_32926 [Mikania micrantha]
MMQPPSLSMTRPEISQTMLKFWNNLTFVDSYQGSFVDDLPEEYMTTKRSLKEWQVPEDGEHSTVAVEAGTSTDHLKSKTKIDEELKTD